MKSRLKSNKAKAILIAWILCVIIMLYYSSDLQSKHIQVTRFNTDDIVVFKTDADIGHLGQNRTLNAATKYNLMPNRSTGSLHSTEIRALTLRRRCNGYKRMVPKYSEFDEVFSRHMIVNTSLELMYCYIPKVANTNFRRMLLESYGVLTNGTAPRSSGFEIYHKYDKYLKTLSTFRTATERENMYKKFKKFIFVRNPLERLVSAFHSKFYHPNKWNRAIFLDMVRKFYTSHRWLNGSTILTKDFKKEPVSFKDYITYLTDIATITRERDNVNEHFATFTRLCRPCDVEYDYIGTYETLEDDVNYVIRKLGLKASFPAKNDNYTSISSSHFVHTYFMDLPLDLRLKLLETHKVDFILFNYSIPKWYFSEK